MGGRWCGGFVCSEGDRGFCSEAEGGDTTSVGAEADWNHRFLYRLRLGFVGSEERKAGCIDRRTQ